MGTSLWSLRHEVLDVGAFNEEPSDYPDFAAAVGKAILDGRVERGVLICGSGVGASLAANKLPGVRAAVCHDTYSAHQGVEHDDMNVLVMDSRVIGEEAGRRSSQGVYRCGFQQRATPRGRLNKVKTLEQHLLKS
jgi:ribose 5-phosphate isomerase B